MSTSLASKEICVMRKFTKVLLLAALPVCLLTACSGRAVDNSQQQASHDSVPLVSVKNSL